MKKSIFSTQALLGLTVLGLALFLLTPAPARAFGASGGIRMGITDDPDSFFFGGHASIAPGRIPLRIEPSLELGIGDWEDDMDYFTIRFNGNVKYLLPLGSYRTAFYPIFGLAVYYFNWDNDYGDDDHTEVGVNLGAGFQLYGFLFDLVVGIADIPDITFTFGYTF